MSFSVLTGTVSGGEVNLQVHLINVYLVSGVFYVMLNLSTSYHRSRRSVARDPLVKPINHSY